MPQPAVAPLVHGRWWIPVVVVMGLLSFGAVVAPSPALATSFRYAHQAILAAVIAFYATHGFRLRRGVWTAQSWRRFAASIIVSLAGASMMLIFAAGVDAQASWVGASRSPTRGILIFTVTATAITGIVMFIAGMHRFASDPAGSQYDSRLVRWLRGA